MKTVQILPELNEGGVERGVVELNREFTARGIENIVISSGGKLASQVEKDGGRYLKFDVCSKNILTAIPRAIALRKILMQLRPDIVHVRSRVPAWLVKFARPNAKVVSTVHGINSVNFYSKIMTNADAIICVSNCVKEHILRNFGADEAKISVVARGVNLADFAPQNLDKEFIADFKAKFGLKQDDFIVSSVGRITQLKDYECVIRALSFLKNAPNFTNAKLLIVGGAREDKLTYLNSLKALVGELGLDKSVIFTGSESRIAQIYALSNVIVSASKKPESFGRSVAEALAMNTPVVATDHGGVKDIIQEAKNGYFFSVGDAAQLAEKIKAASELKFDGFGYISQNFSLEMMAEKTIKVYDEILRH